MPEHAKAPNMPGLFYRFNQYHLEYHYISTYEYIY